MKRTNAALASTHAVSPVLSSGISTLMTSPGTRGRADATPEVGTNPSPEREPRRAPARRTPLAFGDRGPKRPAVQSQRKREAAREEQCDQELASIARTRAGTVVVERGANRALDRRGHRDASAARVGPAHSVDDGGQRSNCDEQQ